MASQVEIFNFALTILGEPAVASPTQGNKRAESLSRVYEITRRALIRAKRWSFAMKRAQLAPDGTPPVHGFARRFLLPSDYLALDFVSSYYVGDSLSNLRGAPELPYSVEAGTNGMVLLCDLGNPLPIRYRADITNPNVMDATFVRALAAQLALDAGWAITMNAKAVQNAALALDAALSQALVANAIERPPEPMADDTWVTGRP